MHTNGATPYPSNEKAFNAWLKQQRSEVRATIYLRETLRLLPMKYEGHEVLLSIFRALSASRYAILKPGNTRVARDAAEAISQRFREPIVYLARVTAAVIGEFNVRGRPQPPYFDLDQNKTVLHGYDWIHWEASQLVEKATHEEVVRWPLWLLKYESSSGVTSADIPRTIHQRWQELRGKLLEDNAGWEVWIDWYEYVLAGSPPNGKRGDAWETAYLDIPNRLSWNDVKSVNAKILSRLQAIGWDQAAAEPPPVEGINGPINVLQLPDGRIAVDLRSSLGSRSPQAIEDKNLAKILSTCRVLASKLSSTGRNTQLGAPYANALTEYLKWLPKTHGAGNIVLADSEARILNKLFEAHVGILNDEFAARLSVFLENHIALRAHYPELKTLYESIANSRINIPLKRDAVEGLQEAIHANPEVFDKSVAEAFESVAEPVPEPELISAEDIPALIPGQKHPTPPKDPIANVDTSKTQEYILATIANGIWKIFWRGDKVAKAIEGWRKAYEQIKPYMEHVLSWLKIFLSGGGGMPPSQPPTIAI